MAQSEDFTTEVTCLWCLRHHAPQLSPLPGLFFLLAIPKTLSGSESSLPTTLSEFLSVPGLGTTILLCLPVPKA